ncbi:carboxypeptidase regulatory-like domain-containing protein [Gemmatimonas sp.]|uniref:TonB-dependent receptor n=1 Tax=Gemmatimonas sp. TaxID=1962908 RepID=UPI0035692165
MLTNRLYPASRTRAMLHLAALLLSFPVWSLRAQGTDASIRGQVNDSAGTPVASATLEIRNMASGFISQVRSSERGRYSATQLPLGGPYRITVRAVGFRSTSRESVILNIGSVVSVDFRLMASTVQLQEVTVSAEPTRVIERNGAATRIGEQQVRELPNQNRRFQDLTKLSPLAGNGTSLGGARAMSTDVRIDGVGAQMNNSGQTFAGPLTMTVEAIREFEIVTNEYDVSKGRQGGGLINAVTKSGSNTFNGSLFSYYRDKQLTTADLRGVPAQNFTVRQQGVSVGGPIIKDKVSFFTVYDRTDQSLPLEVTNVRGPSDEIELGISRDSLARMTSILGRKYGLDTLQPQFGVFSRKPLSQAFFGRVDWQLSPQHRLTLRNNTTLYEDPEEIGPDQTLHYAESRGGARINSYGSLLSLRSTFKPNLVNEFKLQALRFTRERIARNELPRGFVRIASRLPDNSNRTVTVQFGGNRLAPENYNERQFQLANTLYWNRGSQTITLGTDNIITKIARYLPIEQRGLFEFDNLAQLDAQTPARYSRQVPLKVGGTTADFTVADMSLFAQSEWVFGRTLTASAGVRLDGATFLTGAAYNPLVDQRLGVRTDVKPNNWMLSPRAQALWDVRGDGRHVLRVGAGRFTSQPPYNVQVNHILQSGLEAVDIIQVGAQAPRADFAGYRRDLSTVPGIPAGVSPSSIPAYVNYFGKDFQVPTTWKVSGGYEYRVWRAQLGAFGYWARTDDNFQYFDKNMVQDPSFTIEGGRGVFVPPTLITSLGRTNNADTRVFKDLGRVLELVGDSRLEQRSVVLQGALTLPRRSSISMSYTKNSTNDNSSFNCCVALTSTFSPNTGDPRRLADSWGPSDNSFRDKIVAAFLLPPVWGFRVTGSYVGLSGQPFSLVINGDVNGDGTLNNDLAFVFDPDDPSTPADVATSMRRVLANPANRAADLIRDNLGRIAPRNAGRSPFRGQTDLRLARDINTINGQAVELTIDFFNLDNLLNRKWGGQYNLGSSQQLVAVSGFNQASKKYTYRVNENVGTAVKSGSAYQIQVGARYRF